MRSLATLALILTLSAQAAVNYVGKFAGEAGGLTNLYQTVTPQAYGAVGDGVHDDTAAFRLACKSGKRIIIPALTYLVSGSITNSNVVSAVGATLITTVPTNIWIQTCSNYYSGAEMTLPAVTGPLGSTGSTTHWTNPCSGVVLWNIGNTKIHVQTVRGFTCGLELHGDSSSWGVAWNRITCPLLIDNMTNAWFHPTGNGWVNENTLVGTSFAWWGGVTNAYLSGVRAVVISVEAGGQTPNNNRFEECSFEEATAEFSVDCHGSYNLFKWCRWERYGTNSLRALFNGPAAYANQIYGGYGSDAVLMIQTDGAAQNHLVGALATSADYATTAGNATNNAGFPVYFGYQNYAAFTSTPFTTFAGNSDQSSGASTPPGIALRDEVIDSLWVKCVIPNLGTNFNVTLATNGVDSNLTVNCVVSGTATSDLVNKVPVKAGTLLTWHCTSTSSGWNARFQGGCLVH